MKKKLCIITGSRAEWGLFYPLAKEIKKHKKDFILQIIAQGAHLSSGFGFTKKEIEKDGFKINKSVRTLEKGDTDVAIAKSVGYGIANLTKAIKSLKPDLVILLGDRFETFSSAIASLFSKVPIAHLHGGELTEGSCDDPMRHAITKMATLHFVSTEVYRKRVIQMGEDPKIVFNVGALGVDNIVSFERLEKSEFEKKTKTHLGKRNVMITYNSPTSMPKSTVRKELSSLLRVAGKIPDMKMIITKTNPDMYSSSINKTIDGFILRKKKKAYAFTSMGRVLYLNALRFMDLVAGNSSSGIIEVPSFGIPTINIGKRQAGRVKAKTVIDTRGDTQSISKAFKRAFSPVFKRACKKAKNIYGDGATSKRIISIIKKTSFPSKRKQFFDLDFKICNMK